MAVVVETQGVSLSEACFAFRTSREGCQKIRFGSSVNLKSNQALQGVDNLAFKSID